MIFSGVMMFNSRSALDLGNTKSNIGLVSMVGFGSILQVLLDKQIDTKVWDLLQDLSYNIAHP